MLAQMHRSSFKRCGAACVSPTHAHSPTHKPPLPYTAPPNPSPQKRPRPPPSKQAAPPPPLYSAALNRPRRVLGGNFRRGGGALSPRTTISSAAAGPHRQQPWQMLLPGGAPVGALTPEHCRHQVMADLVYLFK